ncbi:putative hemolysin [Aminobacter carboxidus]|uniref:DUF333 domain-containing protein n=1 Tax=Aminobacter carboxidus TaxID=376165 RepID=A0A8E2B9E4_9HYPH|nr:MULTISPECIES: DUF333 domain-containing protein [Aminobacter carboxidus group]MBB6464376.1 hypothetical protein [Aminobacter lissarensis]MBE1207698.1 DUF333 domain-containing protein [Aminobacter carboxidus]
MRRFVASSAGLAAMSLVMMGAAAAPAQKPIGMANPASVHCGNIGGKLEIRKDGAGNETGYCRMPDGSICEEWALFRDQKCVAPKE